MTNSPPVVEKCPLSKSYNEINALQASWIASCVQSPPSLQKQSGRDFCDFSRRFLLRGGGRLYIGYSGGMGALGSD